MADLNLAPAQGQNNVSKQILGLVGAIVLGFIVWFLSSGLSPQGRMAWCRQKNCLQSDAIFRVFL